MKEIHHLMAELADLLGVPIDWNLRYIGVDESDDYYGGFVVMLNRASVEAIIEAVKEVK